MKALEQKATAADPLAQVETFMKIKDIFGGGGGGVDPEPAIGKNREYGCWGTICPKSSMWGRRLCSSLGAPTRLRLAMVGGGGGTDANNPAQQLAPLPAGMGGDVTNGAIYPVTWVIPPTNPPPNLPPRGGPHPNPGTATRHAPNSNPPTTIDGARWVFGAGYQTRANG